MMMAAAMSLASLSTLVIDQHDRSGREFLQEFEPAMNIVKSKLGNAWNECLRLNLFLRYISKDDNRILESKGFDLSLFGHNYSNAVNILNSHFSSTESIYLIINL